MWFIWINCTVYRKDSKRYFKVVFEVLVDIKDIALLEVLKDFFGVGRIYTTKKYATYRVASVSDLMVIINHFTAYPIISPKGVIFMLWSEVVRLIHSSQHHVPETFNYILSIYPALGRAASDAIMQAFPGLTLVSQPTNTLPITLTTINPWRISGYLTLYCTFTLKIEGVGWGKDEDVYNKFRHLFSVGFDIKSLELAQLISSYIGISCYVRAYEQRVDVMAQSSSKLSRQLYGRVSTTII